MAGPATQQAWPPAKAAPAAPRLVRAGRGRQVAYSRLLPRTRNADRLSDLDVAMGVKEEHFGEALGRVRRALGDLGDLVGSYDYLMPLSFPLALYGSGRRRLVDFGRAWARFDRKGPDQPSAEV